MSRRDRPSKLRQNCRRKIAYETPAEAQAAMEQVQGLGREWHATKYPALVYKCSVCSLFHWGHKHPDFVQPPICGTRT